MEFFFPLRQLKAAELNRVLQQNPISSGVPPLSFRDIQGQLKGFIDLIFEEDGRFYVVDYKSNYLGDSFEAYSMPAMSQAMREHRYDLQYLIYTVALHRYLQSRISDYSYEQHFGGVYYLFLRGMAPQAPKGRGVFYDKPDYCLIESLSQLFGE